MQKKPCKRETSVFSFKLISYLSYFVFDLNLVIAKVNGHFWRCMLKHTTRQVRYYKSQSYNAFFISDVCYRSLCVIPFKTDMVKSREHLEEPLLTGCLVE